MSEHQATAAMIQDISNFCGHRIKTTSNIEFSSRHAGFFLKAVARSIHRIWQDL
ncbi:hypothetical protein ACO0LC_05300 [Undibacterium sp. JH2W]|uniref:hypothetical protein n=1 Tax=Undibacterium sp. JH2W TaxID=3413037 RepID=UPI003BF39597